MQGLDVSQSLTCCPETGFPTCQLLRAEPFTACRGCRHVQPDIHTQISLMAQNQSAPFSPVRIKNERPDLWSDVQTSPVHMMEPEPPTKERLKKKEVNCKVKPSSIMKIQTQLFVKHSHYSPSNLVYSQQFPLFQEACRT